MSIAIPSLLFLLVLLVAGLMLLITGVRGYRIGDHPICHRCGFDLFGLPSGVSICSECGSDVSQPNSIRIGHRKRQPGSILLGVLFLLTFAFVASFAGWETAQNINWEQHLPTFWLVHETASADPASRDPAFAELLRRMRAGNLSEGETQKLVVRGLAFQADTSKAWVTAWGDIVESAHTAGKLTTAQWRQYAMNACDMQLIARPKVRQGAFSVPLSLSSGRGRVGSSYTLCVETVGGDNGSDLASENQSNLFDDGSSGLNSGGGGGFGGSVRLDPALAGNAALGQKLVRIQLKERIFPSFQGVSPGSTGTPIAERTIALQAPWELVAADAPTVQPIDDEKYRAAITQSLKVGRCEISGTGPNAMCEVEIKCTGSPVPLAHNVFLRANGRDLPAGAIYFPAGSPGDWGTGQNGSNLTVDRVDIILKPSASVCASSIDLTSFWNGEITIPNVPLTHR